MGTKSCVEESLITKRNEVKSTALKQQKEKDDLKKQVFEEKQRALMKETAEKKSTTKSGEGSESNGALKKFMDREIVELECPVCLEVLTTSPLYKCADDHLICPGCRPRVARCPQCRETYPKGEFTRFRGAERQAERLVGLYMERKQLQVA